MIVDKIIDYRLRFFTKLHIIFYDNTLVITSIQTLHDHHTKCSAHRQISTKISKSPIKPHIQFTNPSKHVRHQHDNYIP